MTSDQEGEDGEPYVDVFFPGARFDSRAAFKDANGREHTASRRRCNYPDNNTSRIIARCRDVECGYIVRARARRDGGYEVTSCHVMHSCSAGSNPSTPGHLVVVITREALRYDANAKPAAVIARAQVDYGYEVTYMQAFRALEQVRRGYKSMSEQSYGLVLPWLQDLKAVNVGSIVDFERAENGAISKAFIMLKSWARSFFFCLPVLSFDACHLRSKEGGTLFLASALTPNHDIVIVAAGIGMIEDGEHWEWFVKNVREGTGIADTVDSVVMSDREKGLDTALRACIPDVPHSYCSFHIKKNVVTTFKTDMKGKIHALAKCLTEHELSGLLAECEAMNAAATEYLKDIGDSTWIASKFPRPRFGMVTTNISESNNSWLLDAREHTWFSCLSEIVRKTQQRMYDKRVEYASFSGRYVPWVEARVMKLYKQAGKRIVSCVTDDIFEVMRVSSRAYVTVNLEKRECSCQFWQEYQYPCIHACAAIIRRRHDPLDYISDYYLASHLQEAFAPYAMPVDISYYDPDDTLPPSIQKRRGRKRKIRLRNRSEYIDNDSPYQCSNCHQKGHNKRTCARRAVAQRKKQKA